jgi:DNA-binding PadR family transcriptional regulator
LVRLTDIDRIKGALELLADLDWIEAKTTETGGRPRNSYTINPRALQ